MRIFNAVKKNNKGFFIANAGIVKYILEFGIFNTRDFCNDALMVSGFAVMAERHADFVQLGTIHFSNNKILITGKTDDFAQRTIVFLCYKDTVDASSAFDCFLDGISAHDYAGQITLLLVIFNDFGRRKCIEFNIKYFIFKEV